MIRFAPANGSGDLGMVDPGDMWPEPHYNAGGRKHLHALGVIAVTYRAFQRNMDDIYKFYLRKQKVPDALMNAYYFSLDEGNRVSVLKGVCKEYETDPKIFALVENLAEYFYWCKNCRDELVHAEQYPALFGGASDTITLTKRIGKTDPKTGYVALSLQRIRGIADKIETGKQQCVTVRIYLRWRGIPAGERRHSPLRFHMPESLPEILRVPKPLKLSLSPPDFPLPGYLRKPSQG